MCYYNLMEMMNNESLISIGFIISTTGFIIMLYNFFKTVKKDNTNEIKRDVEINFKLDNIGKDTGDIKADLKEMKHEISSIREKQIAFDRDLKTLFNRVEALEKKINVEHE